jgi:hypothetical protein
VRVISPRALELRSALLLTPKQEVTPRRLDLRAVALEHSVTGGVLGFVEHELELVIAV